MGKIFACLCLVALLLSACGTAGSTLCSDEAILSKLQNDASPEFVLDGVYYTLPAPAGSFMENGWTMSLDDYQNQSVTLEPGERVSVTFKKENHRFSASLANPSLLPLEAGSACQITQIRLYVSPKDVPADFFVTKYGITPSSSSQEVKAVLKDKAGFKEESNYYYLLDKGEKGSRDILMFSARNGDSVSLKIEAEADYNYRLYKPLAQKVQEQAEKIAAYKAEAEQNCPADYQEIVNSLGSRATVPFCSLTGSVITKGRGNYEGMEDHLLYGQDLSLYVVEDQSGQIYCIYEGYAYHDGILKLPELQEGDIISLWGFSSQITTFQDGSQAPTVIPKILEKDGETIYLGSEYQLK